MGTQKSFERLNPRCVAVVIDPIQSVRGKVVIDAFRLIDMQLAMMGLEARQTTSNVGHLTKPNITALLHGLNRGYYSLPINYRKNDLEQSMLLNLSKEKWVKGVKKNDFSERNDRNVKLVNEMAGLAETYNKWV
jgi:26S proteasome regulatory subunit N11